LSEGGGYRIVIRKGFDPEKGHADAETENYREEIANKTKIG